MEDLKFLPPGERVGTKEMGIFSSRLNNEGTYDPSWFTLWWATHSKTTYITQEHPSKYQGNKPILVVCTDDGKMEMKNGKVFNRLENYSTPEYSTRIIQSLGKN